MSHVLKFDHKAGLRLSMRKKLSPQLEFAALSADLPIAMLRRFPSLPIFRLASGRFGVSIGQVRLTNNIVVDAKNLCFSAKLIFFKLLL